MDTDGIAAHVGIPPEVLQDTYGEEEVTTEQMTWILMWTLVNVLLVAMADGSPPRMAHATQAALAILNREENPQGSWT